MTRFANVGNYINAGQLATAGFLSALTAAQATSPDFSQTAQTAVAEQAKNEIQRYQLESAANVAAYKNKALAAQDAAQAAKIARDTEFIQQRKKQQKMAGRLAAASQLMKIKRDDPVIPQLKTVVDPSHLYKALKEKHNQDYQAILESIKPTPLENAAAARRSSPVNQPSSRSATTTALTSGDLPELSQNIAAMIKSDPETISKLVTSEALRNTDDEFGVVANVFTRYNSGRPEFPRNVGALATPDQYAGLKTKLAVYDPAVIDRLLKPENLNRIADAYKTLDGRYFFKASQDEGTGPNYRPGEDIMFSPGGNYYHY